MQYKENGLRMPDLFTSPLASALWRLDGWQMLGALFTMPWVSLVVAAVIACGICVFPGRRAQRESRMRLGAATAGGVVARYSREHRTLGLTAIGVVAVFLAENLISGYVLDLNGVISWWRYAMPVFTASVGIGLLLAIVATLGSTPPERPVAVPRRTWLTFSPRAGTAGAALAVLALTATTVLAGLASSNINGGPYVFLEIEINNEPIDPLRPWFYGWAYGIPVLICTAVLLAVMVAALHASAVRPFLRPETVAAEQRERRDVATAITRTATSALLLSLAGAWRFIADAGSVVGLTVQRDGGSDSYTAFWRYGEIAGVGGGLAPLLEIAAFVLLFLVIAQLYPRDHGARTGTEAESPADSEAV